ncbi:MAG: hypothetical protein WDZ88_03940 [Candidatus Paceibacterota bacterium]
MKNIFWLLIVVLIVGGSIYLFSQSGTVPELDQFGEDNQNQTNGNESWETYQSNIDQELSFSIMHPATTSISQVQDDVYEIKYIGPNSEQNTEITDGFYVSLQFTTATSLEAYARDSEPVEGDIQSTSLLGREALTYSLISQLSNQPIEHIVLWADEVNGRLLDITYSVHGNRAEIYRDTVFSILDTITFTNGDTPIGNGSATEMTTLQLAMLDYDGIGQESNGPMRGCDRLVYIERTVPATVTPLNTALETLFSLEQERVNGWHNFIASQNDTLSFDRAEIIDGVAHVYLAGELGPLGGVCDNPRTAIQIEETALVYSTVNSVKLYLNGEVTDLIPGGRG